MNTSEHQGRSVDELRRLLAQSTISRDRFDLLHELADALLPGRVSEARSCLERAVQLARSERDYEQLSRAGRRLTDELLGAGEMAAARSAAEYVREAAEGAKSRVWLGSYNYLVGRCHEDRGELKQAYDAYCRCRELWKQEDFTRGERAVLHELGNISLQRGRFSEALDLYQQTLQLATELGENHEDAIILGNIGLCLEALGRWEDATEAFYRVLAMPVPALYPAQHAVAYHQLGRILLRRDKPAKAIEMFQRAFDQVRDWVGNPEVGQSTLLSLGEAYTRQGNWAGAAEVLDKALELRLKAERPIADVLVAKAELALAQDGLELAEQFAAESCRRAAGLGLHLVEAFALRVLALAQARKGDAAAAQQSFTEAIDLLEPAEQGYEMAQVRFQYGKFLLDQGEKEPAAAELRAAARIFRKLAVVAEAEEINRLLYRLEMDADADMALLSGISGLTTLGLEPALFIEQAMTLLREALRFESSVVFYRDRPVAMYGTPGLVSARAQLASNSTCVSPTVLSWPVRCGPEVVGRVHLERREPVPSEQSPLVLDTIANLLANAIQRAAQTVARALPERPELAGLRYRGVVGRTPGMAAVLSTVCKVADTAVPVLIRGETGTGKELVARALHETGSRSAGPFVAINCAAVPENLLEAELFGTEKGAATGVTARKGKFEVAGGGTVFLDEIGDMSSGLQAKLLRVLEEKAVERVGGRQPIMVDVRVVAATNQELEAQMAKGAFRRDLYYRLNGVELKLPPLRERQEDIAELAQHFVTQSGHEFGRSVTGLEPDAMEVLLSYTWPGNIRELQHVIERAVLLAQGDSLTASDLPGELAGAGKERSPVGVRQARELAEEAASGAEKTALVSCLEKAGWNVNKACELAGYSRAQFYRLMQKHGISRPKRGQS